MTSQILPENEVASTEQKVEQPKINNIDIPPLDTLSLLLRSEAHRGDKKADKRMLPYVYCKSKDGESHIFDLNKTWQKIRSAARLLVTCDDRSNICLVASTNWAKRSIFKFAQYTGAHAVSGRFTPGTFTNQICSSFREPSVLVSADPDGDRQAITEASLVNVPVVALCDANTSTENVDVAIPCNNKSKPAVAAVFFLLCRELLRMAGEVSYTEEWGVVVDLFLLKEAAELKKMMEADSLKREESEKARLLAEKEKQLAEEEQPPAEADEKEEESRVESSAVEESEPRKPPADAPQQFSPQFGGMGVPYVNYPMGYGAVGSAGRMPFGGMGFRPQEGVQSKPAERGAAPGFAPQMPQYMMPPQMPEMAEGRKDEGKHGIGARMPDPFAMQMFHPYMTHPQMMQQYDDFLRYQMEQAEKDGRVPMMRPQGPQGLQGPQVPQRMAGPAGQFGMGGFQHPMQPNFNQADFKDAQAMHPQQRRQPGAPHEQHRAGDGGH